ncbi:MAG: hypothetical protein GXY86_14745 [Firmicutes bacterium]|nr:hypothetical protein [Bacillota bacterium]
MDSVFGTDQFNYDPIGRITGQTDPERKYKSYLYDPAGDLLKTQVQSENEGWSREGEYEGVRYRFNRVGNLVERDEAQSKTEFIWDANGRLVESVSDESKTIFAYDPLGRRISKETDGVKTCFYWDGDALLGDVTDDDTREWVYYPGSFEPLAMVRNEEFYLYHNEPNGCPARLLDESGKVVWAARYDAWGKVKKLLVDEVDQPLRLQGQYFDRETGLHYNRFRYYCAEIGGFISQDPLGLAAGENIYRYGPNALGWIDPLGLHCDGSGKAKGLIGKNFEDFLVKKLGGRGSFKVNGREFDGAVGNRWYEAKSGQFWDYVRSDEKNLLKFKSDMGDRLNIARQNNATYELHSNTLIPQSIKDWLTKKGIPFTEWL